MLINQVTRLMRMQSFWHTISIIIWYPPYLVEKRFLTDNCKVFHSFDEMIDYFRKKKNEWLKKFFIIFLMSNSHHVGP